MKKFAIVGVIVLIAAVLAILFFPANRLGTVPDAKDFELIAETPRLTYSSNEDIRINANLKNKTWRSYIVSHGSKIISVSYAKSGAEREDTIVPAISTSSYLGPGRSFSSEETIKISEPGKYTVYVDATIRINETPCEYTKSFDINVE
ncbi:MAG: hypothetical protein ACOYJX_01340 [Acutalibacteraceae bacterium]|jgi:hypothetical protein